ncbi:hypothetical protein G4B88_004378 [Cannabis sativa]|uniref:Uncharacterized protein n=1 Tax=Cannabis sativa TaxID=3483 RepID=A0A7J6I0T5_CANSA|nr:hypothetical protein G4B88_004378 [Cannabis sativa]
MIQRKVSLVTTEKPSSNELYNHWSYNNEEKRKNLSNKFIKRPTVDKLKNYFHFQSKMKFPKKRT